MKKEPIIILLLVLFLVVGFSVVQGQTNQAYSDKTVLECNECRELSKILKELQIFNNNQPGEVVTGMAVLKDGQPGATGFWLDMPIGTCDVTLFSEAGGLSHASGNYSYSLSAAGPTGTGPNTQFCSSNGNSWTSCTKTMTFDEQFHFFHTSGPGDVIYYQIAYQCTLN